VITNAVSTQVWPGAANVHVSIANWVKRPIRLPSVFLLDGRRVVGIDSSLRPRIERPTPRRLVAHRGRSFQGCIPVGEGFLITEAEAQSLLADSTHDYEAVVRRYLMGDDIANDPEQAPTRWIIDFGTRDLEEASRWPLAMAIVRTRVRPGRLTNRDRGFRERWWQFGRPRPAMRLGLSGLERFLVANRVGKRLYVSWADPSWCPGDKAVVFALADDCSLGILTSRVHSAWAWEFSSTLKSDLNYTPTSAFETFPWPAPTPEQCERIADLSRRIVARRREICLERQIGLTKLYNEVDEGAYRELARLHRELDEAVAAAYGWPKGAAQDPAESNRRLLELNRRIAAGEIEYGPFA
jgi:hypothetical protein